MQTTRSPCVACFAISMNVERLSPAGVDLVGDVAQERLVYAKLVKGFSAQSPRPTVADRVHNPNIIKEFEDRY